MRRYKRESAKMDSGVRITCSRKLPEKNPKITRRRHRTPEAMAVVETVVCTFLSSLAPK